MKSPVLLIVFNRPDTTGRVFEEVRSARPPRLYIGADGPRLDRPGEADLCAAVRQISSAVDWPCEVKTLFRDQNLGCKLGPCEAISWFFTHEEEGIILEDDCLPASSFFDFCDELLERYRHDSRIWQISGTDMFASEPPSESRPSYRYVKSGPIWGWASWRRAWKHYDSELKAWPSMSKEAVLNSVYATAAERDAYRAIGNRIYDGVTHFWDYQWLFARNFNSGLSIIPYGNQVRNIGFGPAATHTLTAVDQAPQNLHPIVFPMRYPEFVIPDAKHDAEYLSFFLASLRPKRGVAWRAASRLAALISL
jgi:hypothetical protein